MAVFFDGRFLHRLVRNGTERRCIKLPRFLRYFESNRSSATLWRSGATNDAAIRYYRASEALMNLSSTARQIVFWLLIIAGALLLYKLVNPRGNSYQTVDLTQMDKMIQSGELKELTVKQAETVAIDNHNQ